MTRALFQASFYEEEQSEVGFFLEGVDLVLKNKAWIIFVPPLPYDDGLDSNHSPLTEGSLGEQKRSYLVICPDRGQGGYCAPALVFANDENELVTDFLARMDGIFGDRLIVCPQQRFMSAIGESEAELDEFSTIRRPREGYKTSRLSFRASRLNEIKSEVLTARVYLEAISGWGGDRFGSYEEFFDSLPATGLGVSGSVLAEEWGPPEVEEDGESRDDRVEIETVLSNSLLGPSESEEVIERMMAEGWKIEGQTAESPQGEVVTLPLYVILATERKRERT